MIVASFTTEAGYGFRLNGYDRILGGGRLESQVGGKETPLSFLADLREEFRPVRWRLARLHLNSEVRSGKFKACLELLLSPTDSTAIRTATCLTTVRRHC